MSTRFKSNAGIILAALLTLGGCRVNDTAQAQMASSPPVQGQLSHPSTALDTTTAAALSGAFRAAAQKALPAVVQIKVLARAENPLREFRNAPFRFRFPGMSDDSTPQLLEGMGSGFIFDRRGYILTNDHVIKGAERVRVTLTDGRQFDAKVVGHDPNTDVAVIQIDAGNGATLPLAELGNSNDLRVGDWVLALGNPLGLDFTVTAGIVSAKSRAIGILTNADNTQLESYIQTDAAVNKGNSGGPLVDLVGRVVGINSAIESPTGAYAGASFAIPIDLAGKVASDLIKYGVVHRPRLGISIRNVTPADAQVYKLPSVSGVHVAGISPNSSAAKAGVEMGDVIVGVNGQSVGNVPQLQARIAGFQPGENVTLSIIRSGESLKKTVRLGEFETAVAQDNPVTDRSNGQELLGLSVEAVPGELASHAGLNDDQGVIIDQVDQFSSAADALLGRGLVILEMNGQKVHSVRDYQRIAKSVKKGDIVSLVVIDPQAQDPLPTRVNYRAGL